MLIRLGTCVNLLLDRIAQLEDRDNVNIAFPDDGAAKRFGDLFATTYPNVATCHKVRGEGEKRVVKLKEGLVAGKHCIIVDDLVQSGSTMMECAKELLRNGAACVSAYVTHAIFPKQSYRKFFVDECDHEKGEKRDTFKYFWVVSSHMHERTHHAPRHTQTLALAEGTPRGPNGVCSALPKQTEIEVLCAHFLSSASGCAWLLPPPLHRTAPPRPTAIPTWPTSFAARLPSKC